ncbi:interleukin-17 receptor E-like protein isoform X2 [Embiotoca jacksoni]|uniref:interleukin-17 receptor E-like protein isoform X2 n=1 Tax=Embiotoca jacksoni TaxID=100190 RepID=UPI003704CCC0
MILWVYLLMFYYCLGLNGAAAENTRLDRIEKCGTRCSQGLHCKPKQRYLFPTPCQNPAEGLNTTSVFPNISLSTVMRCDGRQKCSLHLRIKTVLQLSESIHGVTFCTITAGMMPHCQTFSFTRTSRERMTGLQVEIENDCTAISPSQQVQVTVKTVANYCGVILASTYHTPQCINEDLKRHVPECITGRLSYDVNPEMKELSVNVSDMLEDRDYLLRLCHKNFICVGTGASTLIKKEQPVKSVILSYSRPLPCLCIEGWSVVTDARRVQVCPFKDRLKELWTGITFDPVEKTLLWEPSCPVTAVVSLCEKREDSVCVDLPHSSRNVGREKITFTKVDPHPKLCMKFTAGSQSWTRCPFADGRFQAWDVVVTRQQGREEVKVRSQITTTFSLRLCVKFAGHPVCQNNETHLQVEKHKAVDLNLTGKLCNSCLQVKMIGVKYAVTVIHCLKQCNQSSPDSHIIADQPTWDLTWVVVPAGVCLASIIIVTLLLHVVLTVHQRRKPNRKKERVCTSEKQVETQPALHGGVLIPDSLHCGNEKANLISN